MHAAARRVLKRLASRTVPRPCPRGPRRMLSTTWQSLLPRSAPGTATAAAEDLRLLSLGHRSPINSDEFGSQHSGRGTHRHRCRPPPRTPDDELPLGVRRFDVREHHPQLLGITVCARNTARPQGSPALPRWVLPGFREAGNNLKLLPVGSLCSAAAMPRHGEASGVAGTSKM